MIYSISISTSTASYDFINKFPFELTFSKSTYDEFYIIGRATNSYNSYYEKEYTYLQGDIALLKDNTYIVFKETTHYEKESLYIGNIMNFNNIIPNINADSQNSATDQNMAFSSDTLCSPYIVPINGEKIYMLI